MEELLLSLKVRKNLSYDKKSRINLLNKIKDQI